MNDIAVCSPLWCQSQQNSSGLVAKGPSDQNSFSNIPHEGKQHTPLYERASPNHAEPAFFNASSTSSSSENEENTGPTAKWVVKCEKPASVALSAVSLLQIAQSYLFIFFAIAVEIGINYGAN